NAESVRDWGYAEEFIKIVVQASEIEVNDLFVIGTGHQMSVIDFLKTIFKNLKIEVEIRTGKNNLIYIIDTNSNKVIAEEMGVNKIDVQRKFKADINEIKNFGLEPPKIKGESLINLLIDDAKK
ncbi:unnamed protein product, partial [Laminaria digitata]